MSFICVNVVLVVRGLIESILKLLLLLLLSVLLELVSNPGHGLTELLIVLVHVVGLLQLAKLVTHMLRHVVLG